MRCIPKCTNALALLKKNKKKTQLESFISFIQQTNCESENQALCCGCKKQKAGADIGPVIKEPQSNRKQKTNQDWRRQVHITASGEGMCSLWLKRLTRRRQNNLERCFQTGGRSGKVSSWKQHGDDQGEGRRQSKSTNKRRKRTISRKRTQVTLGELKGEEQRVGAEACLALWCPVMDGLDHRWLTGLL